MGIDTAAETAVLDVLAPGGLLSADQIMRQALLSSWSTRRAIGHLSSRGLIMPTLNRARWSITARGLAAWTGARRR